MNFEHRIEQLYTVWYFYNLTKFQLQMRIKTNEITEKVKENGKQKLHLWRVCYTKQIMKIEAYGCEGCFGVWFETWTPQISPLPSRRVLLGTAFARIIYKSGQTSPLVCLWRGWYYNYITPTPRPHAKNVYVIFNSLSVITYVLEIIFN